MPAAGSAGATAAVPIAWECVPARRLVADDGLRRQWDGVNARNGQIPALSSDIVVAALGSFARGREKLLVGRRGDAIVAMAVLFPNAPLQWSTFQPSQLPLGALVVDAGEDLGALGSSLLRSKLAMALSVSFTQVDPLVVARAADSQVVRSDDYIDTAWIDVAGDFDTYWAGRGKNLRQNLRKQRNRLAADGTEVAMQTRRAPEEMAAALVRYGELESRGWKAAGGTAIHADNPQGTFYRALFEAAARRGEAVVYEYLLGTRTVAMNLCIQRGGTLVILKTTYDESVKPLSPAFLLQEDELRSIFSAAEFRRIEFYGRVMEWHTRWTESSRTLFHTTVYRWPLVKQLAERRRRAAARKAAAAAADVAPAPAGESATS